MVVAVLEDGAKLVNVNLEERSYPVYIAPGLISRAGQTIKDSLRSAHRCTVVTSPEINRLHGSSLAGSLHEAGIDSTLTFVPDGEESKSWEEAGKLISRFVDLGLDRRSIIIAFGGGVVGDLAGFVSAIYLRGVRLIHIPTTLLAQVDSGIGGKTAVNHPKGKNLIGAFHQPSLVISDPRILTTLPRRELASGLAEVVKYAVIADAELFGILEAKTCELVRRDVATLTEVIARCCDIKARLIELDERDDKGLRAVLNYGHTLGHAVEILTDLRTRHGEAVALGMTVAARLAVLLGILNSEESRRQDALLGKMGLATELPRLDTHRLLEIMHRDKKVLDSSVTFVLPTGIGKPPVLRAVPDELIVRALEGSSP